ncbi:hypothetical protein [Streptomyces sp. NPDC002580]|uniref:hypothetical protein n=1 Tax=Streptomyces sp. NPDC002580 TaxID=3364653 RepID=UPI00369B4F54
MARKLNKKQAAALSRLCLIVAAVLAVPTYCLVPVDGRGPVAYWTLAVAAAGYGATRYIGLRAWAAASRPAPRVAK